uniref:phosphoinositide 3-kinase adapter protein 1 isoform X1 n=1 Tax=Doryrhamphus excisus TaxID=161450 RepID=UPI0025AE1E0C|nr:phosphoinositide 3-kinase adapter protein 1 isoform X1 [Doryrhamphus excisus]XP_057905094.1 phosphoinositide 3-kinase adapter protein 1 isoform X1 [Doryrhamphus excisus]XP_057905104.1 phosphoinositide 3-kinase adapter protein 1 isoform X1 [Doryrhamphus excisus]XP_057905115.1 phosphoinositide 3-kinase adapter protein 1 isoform X1 [Doryrhamphus excisus]
MEELISGRESASPASPSTQELLILHTADAREWASYLQNILKLSKKFQKNSILLYSVGPADKLHGCNFESFHSCKCIMLLLTGAFLDILCEPELQGALHGLLQPSDRVVVLLCGVSEDDVLMLGFEGWSTWRKLDTEDEPAVYVSTILETIANSRLQTENVNECAALDQLHSTPRASDEDTASEDPQEEMPTDRQEAKLKGDNHVTLGVSATEEMSPHSHVACLAVQPSQVLCGVEESIFIILTHKMDDLTAPEVEFTAKKDATKRVPGIVVNEYTIRVKAPEMPAGVVSLALWADQSCISLKSITYYTNMGQVSRCLEKAADPLNFLCQAFNVMSNSTESLDNILTGSLKSKMPASGLQMFGMGQIEERNMAAYKRDEELPTLLHFAAKYGLKKLTSFLLHIPGALQAYSVMNKNGDYPNTLAEKSGFSELRQFIDELVSHSEDITEDYEEMSTARYSGCPNDMYVSMLGINPECADDLYEVMSAVVENPEEAMLRTFFQAKHGKRELRDEGWKPKHEQMENDDQKDLDETDIEFDPYKSEDIYDTVDEHSCINAAVLCRPPAPIPRPEIEPEPEKPETFISRVFSDKVDSQSQILELYQEAQPAVDPPTAVYDAFAGMKTPGQRQLITLQERVKVGEITVDEAVQAFRSWQLDHESRASSVRYQQDNLRRLRQSINRRHNEYTLCLYEGGGYIIPRIQGLTRCLS